MSSLWLADDNFHNATPSPWHIYCTFNIISLVIQQEMRKYLPVCLVSFLSVKVRFILDIWLYFAEQHKSLIADVCLTHYNFQQQLLSFCSDSGSLRSIVHQSCTAVFEGMIRHFLAKINLKFTCSSEECFLASDWFQIILSKLFS